MPPKAKTTKDDILNVALELVRQGGLPAVNARTIAGRLGCSTQPVFSNFPNMEALHQALLLKANDICQDYLRREVQTGAYPIYKANGMAYIRFAKEERELFKLLFMCDSTQTPSPTSSLFGQMEGVVQQTTGLGEDDSRLFHLEMWTYVHGIATMFATRFLDLPWELVSKMMTDAYQGLRKQYGME